MEKMDACFSAECSHPVAFDTILGLNLCEVFLVVNVVQNLIDSNPNLGTVLT
jgi:hypothetical protein